MPGSGVAGTRALSDITPGTVTAGKAVVVDSDKAIDTILGKGGSNFIINTVDDNRNIRLNSRSYPITSGEHSSVQVKPSVTVGGTTGITAIEVSPRFQSGIAGGKIVGVFSNPDLKGAAGGNVGPLRCFEGKMESASGSTRTVTTACTLEAIQAMHGTVTQGPTVILVNKAGGNVLWESVIELKDTEAGVWNNDPGTELSDPGGTVKGYIKVIVNDVDKYIALYDGTSLAD